MKIIIEKVKQTALELHWFLQFRKNVGQFGDCFTTGREGQILLLNYFWTFTFTFGVRAEAV